MSSEPPSDAFKDRVEGAARTLDAMTWALKYGVCPGLVVTTLALLAGWSNRPAAAVVIPTSGAGVVASMILAGVLGACASALRIGAARVEAMTRLDRRLADGLDRIVAAIEAAPGLASAAATASETKARRLAEVRQAIRGGQWIDAANLARDFADVHPDDPDSSRLGEELDAARRVAGRELRTRLQAAREVNDPERVLQLRDDLRPLLDADDLLGLDRDLAKWFLSAIHRRLRAGTVRADVATLAARVAESLDATPEGASLRASLPTLRRAAGLCARCGQPYTGIADACPACLATASPPIPVVLPSSPGLSTPDGAATTEPEDSEFPRLDLDDDLT